MSREKTKGTHNTFTTLGATNHSKEERQTEDYYATEPKATKILLQVEKFHSNIWEPCCGEGHISEQLIKSGYNVKSTDLIDRGYGQGGVDFLRQTEIFDGDIITNPPYKGAMDFVLHALKLVPEKHKVAMFLKILFLESQKRKNLFLNFPPKIVYISSSRLNCAKNGDFITYKSSAIGYAWYIWEKGWKGDPILKWIN